VTPDEDKQLRLLGDALLIVREWENLTGRPDSSQPVPGSELAEDDRRTHPYQVSHAVRAAMMAAVDHLGCLRDSLFEWSGSDRVTARIHIYGQFALVRGALENASRAVWMLELDDRDERILRRLQLEWSEVRAQEQVRDAIGPPGRSMPDQLDDLTVLIQPTGIDPDEIRSGASYATMVKAAGAHLAADGSRQVVIWRMCSALSHGDFRGTLGYTDRQVLAEISPGVALAKVTGSVPLLTAGSLDAIDTMKVALRLYGRRTM
jgi:hypothetical protein